MSDDAQTPYSNLSPDAVLNAVERSGWRCDGRQLALNSFENRVYQIGLEDGSFVVAKFYRTGRWSDAAILEEHRFTQELAALELPVVPPLVTAAGETLFHDGNFRVALFPRRGGRTPDLEHGETLKRIGRLMGRMHGVAAQRPFEHRETLDIQSFAIDSYQFLLSSGFVPPALEQAYQSLAETLVAQAQGCFERAGNFQSIRLHGDCHAGNILWTDEGPHFVDFDDARMGPAIQDLWMCLSGDREERAVQMNHLLDGYETFFEFDYRQLHLIEALRTLRMIHYAAWIARRWADPAFPRAFPWFDGPRYWDEHILALREQSALMDEQPLSLLVS
ncbi:aminoglycoside phosphotransferase [Magnetococcus marinus MC-1]|uniref:Stress response kinase A n=1 Tax=Magnetococcus marinus (strain ATCC BAA-1437 / JCM 17883 / MC-1) TaxID=156889 RepID=A0LAM7_MAGMM|nr:serine/threonine protein kinase [Magnetococcus marinus]ABK45020.1 aminoglycoside phosphotransferase [Magnetococcus marinus MC-1]